MKYDWLQVLGWGNRTFRKPISCCHFLCILSLNILFSKHIATYFIQLWLDSCFFGAIRDNHKLQINSVFFFFFFSCTSSGLTVLLLLPDWQSKWKIFHNRKIRLFVEEILFLICCSMHSFYVLKKHTSKQRTSQTSGKKWSGAGLKMISAGIRVFPFPLIQKTEQLYHKEEQWLCNISDFVVLCLFDRNCEGRNIRYRTCSNTVSQDDMLWGPPGVSICRSATNLYRIEMPAVHKFIQMPHPLHVRLLDIWTNLVILPVTSKRVALTAPFNTF